MGKLNEIHEYIDGMRAETGVIMYDDGALEVTVKEDVSIDDIYSAIAMITELVVEREFEYELIDLMLPYFLISFFTDIEPPMLEDDDGEEYPDYEECYKIATWLNLEYELTQVSPLVAGYIYMMTQNIWRRLEYHKSQGAYLQRQLTDAMAAFYELMDELDDAVKAQQDVDVEGFTEQLQEISAALKDLSDENSVIKTTRNLAVVQ